MEFSGTELFESELVDLWGRLTDMTFISGLIPDVERINRIELTEFSCRVRPRLSFLSGALDLTFKIVEAEKPQRLKINTTGKVMGGAVVVEAELLLAARGNRTELAWCGSIVNRKGLLRAVSTSLIQGAAQRVIDDFWTAMHEALGREHGDADV